MMNEDHARFLSRYNINILDTNKRYVRRVKPNMFVKAHDKEVFETCLDMYEEPLVTLTIPKSQLQALVEIENLFYNNRNDPAHRTMFEAIMDQKHAERYYREKHPSVKSAYEQYSMLLNLVKENGIGN